jgi:hypothetical protein
MTLLTDEQIDEAILAADSALAAAGHSYHDPEHDEDIREALRGRMAFDQVVCRGVERIRGRD